MAARKKKGASPPKKSPAKKAAKGSASRKKKDQPKAEEPKFPEPDVSFRDDELPCKLSDAERAERAHRAAAHLSDRDQKEEALKSYVKEQKGIIANVEAEMRRLSGEVLASSTYRKVRVKVVTDWKAGVVTETRTDTGEVIAARPILPEERQRRLFPSDGNGGSSRNSGGGSDSGGGDLEDDFDFSKGDEEPPADDKPDEAPSSKKPDGDVEDDEPGLGQNDQDDDDPDRDDNDEDEDSDDDEDTDE